MEILKVENVTKIYGKKFSKVKAIDNISFSVCKGEFVAIVGSSGSGKSTLLHMLGGIDKPTYGNIYINGINIYNLKKDMLTIFRRENIGFIYQFYNLIPILNVEENIILPLELNNEKIDKHEISNLLNMLGLEQRRKHLPSELSGGQQQRTSIGRALVTKPSIILADEPTGNLDVKSTNEIMEIFKKMNTEYNQTIIMITHNPEIAKLADRIICIENGMIQNN